MKILTNIIFVPLALITGLSYAQTYSTITYDAGTSIEIQTGADVCATDIIINGTYTGGGTICSGPLPVTLLSLTCSVDKNNVTLNWTTETELNNSGFDIERQKTEDKWLKIAFIPGSGTTSEQKNYAYTDKKLNTGKYNYRLKQTDYNGNYEYFLLENDVNIKPPRSFSMGQNYPNPSNPKSKIDYEVPVNGKVTIKLYNLLGQEVINIVNEIKEAGYYTAEFDGANLASGVYFYRITADGSGQSFIKTIKLVLIK